MVSDNGGGNTKQKTFYPEVKTAEWIEETSEKSERSESFVISRVMEKVAESHDFDPIFIHEFDMDE